MTRPRIAAIGAAVVAALAIILAVSLHGRPAADLWAGPAAPGQLSRPTAPQSYLGVYVAGVPESYAGVTAFTAATGVRPNVVVYYSGWYEPFKVSFAADVVRHAAVPLVQIDPSGVSLAAIAGGQYDPYLRSYAAAVRAFGSRVILSFGHEMNGHWYSWGYRHTSPAVFVAAWRHIVTIFRAAGARNVTWLWTVNISGRHTNIPSPARWWPGNAYVTWVGIDGYYYKPSWTFASLFGPTIKAVRALTIAPILIAETSVKPTAGKPDKIADLFAGVRAYGLLGLVWFDTKGAQDWSLSGAAAVAAFRRGAAAYKGPGS
jgi:mannan endo-1,4-beta-mannosidase